MLVHNDDDIVMIEEPHIYCSDKSRPKIRKRISHNYGGTEKSSFSLEDK